MIDALDRRYTSEKRRAKPLDLCGAQSYVATAAAVNILRDASQ